MTDDVLPFRIDVPDAELDDLRGRLRHTRWPERETVDDWSQGVPLAYLREVCDHWLERYNWRAREAALNTFAQYRTEIDGLGIHFVHVRSPHPDAFPLVLTHGWPGSVVEFQKVIGPLADPTAHGGDAADAFHIVCPSLPGYGFSDKPAATGWGTPRIATAWDRLMVRLGYTRYGAQGGDWGASVSTAIGSQDLGHCAGIHLNMALAGPRRVDGDPGELSDEEREALRARTEFRRWGTGYSKQQSTRPQTLGYGLTDSPAGQAAWILEKFQAWSDCDGHPENAFDRDDLLDNIMLYWLTASATSSARLYWESFGGNADPVDIPTGVAVFPAEVFRPSRRWVEARYRDLRHWTEMPRGGHFAAMEQPDLFVRDVRAFFRLLR